MMPYGQLLKELYDIIPESSNEDMQKRIMAQVNYQYLELCKEVSWANLRTDPVTLDFSASGVDSSGLFLPSDLLGIDLVWDSTNDVEFFRTDEPTAQLDEWGLRYYLHTPNSTSFFDGTDLVLAKGAATFTSALLTAGGTDPDGLYAVFDDELGYYKITNSATPFSFEPTYHGETKSNKPFSIRPWQTTQKLVILDGNEDLLTDRSVKVYYWRAPTPLYRSQDLIQLPSVEVLKFRVLRSIHEAKARFPVSETMLDKAFRRAVKLNDKFPRKFMARSRSGTPINTVTQIYKDR